MARKSEDAESINVGLISPECIDRVVSFISVLSSIPAKDIAIWEEPKDGNDGVMMLSLEPSYHCAVEELMKALNENHFVQSFDWGKWQSTAMKIYKEPSRLSKATLRTCIKLITLHVRTDRFVGGHFGAMVSEGHIVAILRRLAELRK
jgi:hypothetical protein